MVGGSVSLSALLLGVQAVERVSQVLSGGSFEEWGGEGAPVSVGRGEVGPFDPGRDGSGWVRMLETPSQATGQPPHSVPVRVDSEVYRPNELIPPAQRLHCPYRTPDLRVLFIVTSHSPTPPGDTHRPPSSPPFPPTLGPTSPPPLSIYRSIRIDDSPPPCSCMHRRDTPQSACLSGMPRMSVLQLPQHPANPSRRQLGDTTARLDLFTPPLHLPPIFASAFLPGLAAAAVTGDSFPSQPTSCPRLPSTTSIVNTQTAVPLGAAG